MSVKLVNYSQGKDGENLEESVCYCARVSNPSNQMNTATNQKLARYLMKNHHWSPFEMVSICLEINTTRDIGRQILRHRSFSFQEFSQRYADPTALGIEYKDARLQDKNNRQNSIELGDKHNDPLQQQWIDEQKKVADQCQNTYDWAVSNGIAKEQARAVLPEGITMSRLYMNGTLRNTKGAPDDCKGMRRGNCPAISCHYGFCWGNVKNNNIHFFIFYRLS